MNAQVKSAILLIDNLLNNPKKYSRGSFAERLEEEELLGNPPLPSSDATITRLLRFIYREIGIRIKVDRATSLYRIDYDETDPNYVARYYQYKNLYFRNLLQKTRLHKSITEQYISFGSFADNQNAELINPLLAAILENRKIKIEYLPFYREKPESFTVSPLFIREYLNRWYLVTENLENRHPIFALDRISDHQILKAKFKRTNPGNSHIFKNTIGVTLSAPVEKVKLWVSKQQYPYFRTLPFHASQKTEQQAEGGFIISFEVTLNFELKQWMLFFGSTIKVLEPASLQNEIISNLKNTLNKYNK